MRTRLGRGLRGRLLLALVVQAWLMPGTLQAEEEPKVKLDGYAEWYRDGVLTVDGQRVQADTKTRFKGEAQDLASIPLGFECKVRGLRGTDGIVTPAEVESKPNGEALFDADIAEATNEAEAEFRRVGIVYEPGADGSVENIGRLWTSGAGVMRVRSVTDALLPPYLKRDDVRVYVVDNEEWNAFAMGNHSIYVFQGLLDATDDDELAIVLGHELVHATHEHTRRHLKKDMWTQLGVLGISVATEEIDSAVKREVLGLMTDLFATAYSNGYGRKLEDQADRVGLRYAYEAGYDVTKAPRLWQRFAEKYGEDGKVVNFFFGSHSQSKLRATKLSAELTLNYPRGPRGGETPRLIAEARAREQAKRAKASSGRIERAELTLGMTAEQVRAMLGAPESETPRGQAVAWSYAGLTVVLTRGRVTAIE